MNKIIILSLILSLFWSCQSQENISTKKEYPRWIGDIKKTNSDNPNFELCNGENNVKQYFNNSQGLEYYGGKTEILKEFNNNFVPSKKQNQNGIIRIRFIVNCKGETGRFRIIEADNNYKEFKFDSEITNQLLKITKALNDWIPKEIRNKEIDYYQYLIFKIANGKISEILP